MLVGMRVLVPLLAIGAAGLIALMEKAQDGSPGLAAEGPQGRSPRDAEGPEGRRAPRADAGPPKPRPPGPVLLGTDPPGRLRAFGSPDGGVVAQSDAGDELRREVQELRARITALEAERAQHQQQSQQLTDVVRQLQEIRGQLAGSEQRKVAEEEQQKAQYQELQSGVTALQQAQSRLAEGDYTVEAQLEQAQSSFPPQAQKDIAAARGALQNRDLSAARFYLTAAIAHAQQGR